METDRLRSSRGALKPVCCRNIKETPEGSGQKGPFRSLEAGCGGVGGGQAWSGATQQEAEMSLIGRLQHN